LIGEDLNAFLVLPVDNTCVHNLHFSEINQLISADPCLPNNMWMKGVSRELNIAGIGWQQGIHPIMAGN
jgi:hypothetical protein